MPDSPKKRAKLKELAPLRIPKDYEEDQYRPVDNFLKQSEIFESAGGTIKDHPVITDPKSAQHGKSAMGNYGLMSNTVREIINRGINEGKSNVLSNKIDKPEDARIDTELLQMPPSVDMRDDDQFDEYLKNRPDTQEHYAKELAKHLLDKTDGEEGKAHYMWNAGHNKDVDKIKPKDLQENVHYRKWKMLKDELAKRARKKED